MINSRIFRRIAILRQQGTTLIELLVVMGLLASLLVVLTTIFTSSADQQQLSRNYSAVTSGGQFIMARLNYDIGQASAVTTPAALGSSAPALVMTVSSTAYTYALSAGNLQLTDASGTDNINDNNTIVSGLSFQWLGNSGGKPTISYSFTLAGTADSHGINSSQTFSGTAELR